LWIVDNQTTGNYTVTILTTATNSSGIVPARGYMTTVFCDGTNVKYADLGNVISNTPDSVPAGLIFPYAGISTPTGYLFCDGAPLSRTTYARLYSAIGTLWGAGDGTTTFNLPDLRGMFLRGTGTNGSGTSAGAVGPAVGGYVADTYLNHTHDVTDPGHTHTAVGNTGSLFGSPPYVFAGSFDNATFTKINSAKTGVTVSTSTTGGTETKPKNYGVSYIIKS
jgi:microcystin-dependent protein